MPDQPQLADDLTTEAANWLRLQELYHLLEHTPPEQQTEVLAAAGADAALRERVLSLLATSNKPRPALAAEPRTLGPGSRIGPFSLLRSLGSGGLGSVYLVERVIGGAVQQCALKLLSMRPSDPAFRARFAREEQILATLQHPNITHLLDAGFSDLGQPYLVMDYVDGVHLTQYCDDHSLNTRQRLEIFLLICDAVIYAHGKLVVHLDLKPSNVLVTASGQIKLLDFGTSKLIEADAGMTSTIMATPAYASPEQLLGEPVTTSCDLYSLGAMLYELLAGQRPFESTSAVIAISRASRELEPPRLTAAVTAEAAQLRGLSPQRLKRMLRGDLASIVERCLRSRPRDRYSSVEALAEDLRRYLKGWPVLARRQTTRYRLAKFSRRHRVGLAVAVVTTLLLLGAGIQSYLRQQQALREARRAERMQTFLYRLLYVANTNYTGKANFSVPDFLDLGARLAPTYLTEPSDLRKARLGLAESMSENDDIHGADALFPDIIRSAQQAGDLDTEAEAEATAGYVAFECGRAAQAEQLTGHALTLSERRGAAPTVRVWAAIYYAVVRDEGGSRTPTNLKLIEDAVRLAVSSEMAPRETADAYYNLGLAYGWRHRYQESEAALRSSLALYEQDPEAQCDRADIRRGIAQAEENLGRGQQSLTEYQGAYQETVRCAGPASYRALHSQTYVAEALLKQNRFHEAQAMMEAAMPAWHALGLQGPLVIRPVRLLAQAYVENAKYSQAEQQVATLFAAQHDSSASQSGPEAGMLQYVWARALAGEHRPQEALEHARAAQQILAAEPNQPNDANKAKADALAGALAK